MSKQTKTMSERAAEADANRTDVAKELGLTSAEMKIITAFVGLCDSRIESAPVEVLSSACEKHIAKKFPSNIELQESVAPSKIDDDALEYVINTCMGYPSYNLRREAPVEKAKEDFHKAAVRLMASPADPDREAYYTRTCRWMAQMQVQQAYKDSLAPIYDAIHHLKRGYLFSATPINKTEAAVDADESLKVLMG